MALRIASLLLFAGAAAGFHVWHTHRQHVLLEASGGYEQGPFVVTAMPREAVRDTVLIVAPVNCPRNAERFRRSQVLASELSRMGIPNQTTTNISFRFDPQDSEARTNSEKAMDAFKSGPPLVFINGLAKANPSPDEVAVVFERTRAKGSSHSET